MSADRLRLALRRPWVGPLLALAAVYLLFAVLCPATFPKVGVLVTMARQTAVVGVAASGMSLVIMLGGIDLSVGSMIALTTVVMALLLNAGAGPWMAALGGVLTAAGAGAANGGLVAYLRITPFIVTLGSMSVLRGAAKGLAHEQNVYTSDRGLATLANALPASWSFLVFPPAVWILLVVGLATAGLLRHTRFGRHVVAIGSNEETARLCGVSVPRMKLAVYALGGALAGLAGVIEFGTLTVGDPTDSVGRELDVIASVVIGGGALSGGEGSVAGALIGAFLMTVIKTGCQHAGLHNWVQEIVTGAIIVAAAAIDRLRHRRA